MPTVCVEYVGTPGGSGKSPRNAYAVVYSNRVSSLEAAIYEYIAQHNTDPQPFVWTKSIDAIIIKVHHGKALLGTSH